MIRVNEFAANITRHQGIPAALIIGLDGGASLLNHARPIKMRDDLLNDSAASSSTIFNQHAIGAAWRRWGRDERQQFMKDHTGSEDLSVPDGRAIDCIAQMIEGNHIQVVVATDTGQVLFDEL